MTPLHLAEPAVRACVLAALVWALLRIARVRGAAEERAAWLAVLLAGASLPLLLPLLRQVPRGVLPALPYPPAAHSMLAGGGAKWLAAYLAVSALLLARVALGLFAAARLWAAAAPVAPLSGDVPVRAGGRVRAPASIGGGILLPADWERWSPRMLDRVLAHERSHVRRGDFYWQLLAQVYRCVFWASPLGWWLVRRLALLAEQLSDDAALAAHGDPAGYAEMLVAFARRPCAPAPALAMARPATLSARVDRILAWRTAPRPTRRPLLFTALVTIASSAAILPGPAAAPPGTLDPLPPMTERLPPLPPLLNR